LLADELSHQFVGVVKILKEFGKEHLTVFLNGGLEPNEDAFVPPRWIVRRFEQIRRYSGKDHCLPNFFRTLLPQVSDDFATAHRETDQCEITQRKFRDERSQVFDESVVVIASCGLAGLTESAAVVCDDPVTRSENSPKLLVPGRPAQWVSVDKHHGFT
jgi:hypothetical protein